VGPKYSIVPVPRTRTARRPFGSRTVPGQHGRRGRLTLKSGRALPPSPRERLLPRIEPARPGAASPMSPSRSPRQWPPRTAGRASERVTVHALRARSNCSK
jgi:hypothetical protein